MSDFLKHECGIAAVRLRKPLAYYYDRYGTCLWGLNKLFLLMEKQHNRGQDGTGIGWVAIVDEKDVEASLTAGNGGVILGRMVPQEGVRVRVSGE